MPNPKTKIGIWIILSLSISLLSGCILFWALPTMMGGGGDSGSSGDGITTGSSGGLKTITGIIYETIYGSVKITPSGGVSVTYEIGGNTYQATTGSDGSFTLSGLPEGTGKLKASKDGYTENELSLDSSASNLSRSITRRNSNHVFISSSGGSIDTFNDSSLPKCQVNIPAGALTSDTEMELTPFITVSDLPGNFPAGILPLAGANLKSTPSTVFVGGNKAECYIILPSYMRPDSLTGATIGLMEYVSGQWVEVSPGSGAYISSGQWEGYLGPNPADPAKISGCYPWCYVVKFASTADTNYAYVSGKVADISDTPLSGILVVGYGAAAMTNQHGDYVLGPLTVVSQSTLVPVTAYFSGYLPTNQFISLQPGDSLADVNFTLKSLGDLALISGKVTDASTGVGIAGAEVSYKRSPAIKSLSYDNRGTLTDISDDTFTIEPSPGVVPTAYEWFVTTDSQTFNSTLYTSASVVINNLVAELQSQGLSSDIGAYRVGCNVSLTVGQTTTIDGGFQITRVGIVNTITDIQLPIMIEFGAEVYCTTNSNGSYRFLDVPIGEPLVLSAEANNYNSASINISPLIEGDTFPQDFQLTAVGADTTPPTITANNPANNAPNIAIDTNVQVTFSEPMNNSTINSTTFRVNAGSDIAGQIAYNSSNYTATFTPSAQLNYNTDYTVTVSTGAQDLAGNAITGTYTFFFSTISDMPNIPASFSATALSASQIRLTWQDNSTNETGFAIERSASSTGPWSSIYLAPANTTSYIDTGLTAGTVYYYHIYAFNLSGSSDFSSPSPATTAAAPTAPPTAPTGLVATAVSAAQVNLAWTDTSNNEEGFDIERKTGAGGTYANIAVINAPNTVTYTDTSNLSPSTIYYYRVKATNSIGFNYSTDASVTTPEPAQTEPNAPSNLVAIAVSSIQIDLSWQDNSDNEDGFRIQRKMGAGGSYSTIATLGTNTTSYHDSGLNPSTVYYYRVQAYNSYGSGYSVWSAEANTSTSAPAISAPIMPSNLTATAVSSTQINLAWQDNSTNEDGFKIYQSSTGAVGSYYHLATVAANTTAYSVQQALSANTTYYFQVTSYNNVDESPYSSAVHATTWPTVPSAPSLTSPSNNATEVSLKPTFSWTANGTSNQLQISTTNTFAATVVDQSNITETSYTLVSNMAAGTDYYWRVRTSNISGISSWSSISHFKTTTVPYAPSNLNAGAISSSTINIYWNGNSTNHDGFRLYRSTNNIDFAQIVTQTNTFYTDIGLTANTTYYYKVTAYNSAGESAASNTEEEATYPPIPSAPALASPANGATGLELDPVFFWEATTYAANYQIQVKTASNDWSALTYDYFNIVGISYQIYGLNSGTTYNWRVRASNVSGTSSWSSTTGWSFTTDIIPAQPINMSATAVSSTQVNLSWEDKSSNETGFQIEYSTDNFYFYNLDSVGQNQSTCTHYGASPNTTYYYRVYAYNSVGNSLYSDAASDMTWPPAPGSAVLNTPNNGATAVALTPTLNWYSAEYASTYQLQVSTTDGFSTTVVDQSGIAATSFNVTGGLNPDITYYWHVKSVNVSGESGWSSTRNFTTANYQPDLWIKRYPETDALYVGDGTYNSDGQSQTKQAFVDMGVILTYYIKVQNDGELQDVFTLVGTPGNSQWTLSYYDPIGVDITLLMTNTGFSTTYLNSGDSITITMTAMPLTDTAIALSSFIIATSHSYISKKDTAKAITDVSKWVEIATGDSFAIGRKTDGTIWGWGSNTQGQLGLGDTNNRWGPVQIGSDTDWTRVSVGMDFVLAIKSGGTLWSWGSNMSGQLGFGYAGGVPETSPTKVNDNTDWAEVAAGNSHSLARKTDNTLWSWGANGSGQLGKGDSSSGYYSPTPVTINFSNDCAQIAAGNNHSLARKTNGTIWAWGDNIFGQLGQGDNTNDSNCWSPRQIQAATDWAQVAAGGFYSLARKDTTGALYAWGANSQGQLGLGNTESYYSPTVVPSFACKSVRAGASHAIAYKNDGSLWTWGDNMQGQLGLGHTITPISSTTQVPGFSNCAFVNAGNMFSVAVKQDGTLWTWGSNYNGQLGQCDDKSRPSPALVYLHWIIISAGSNGMHTIALRSDGTLWAWGLNDKGQLGLGYSGSGITTPTRIGTDTNWVYAAAGDAHSLAIKTYGTLTNVYAWGDNTNGELGRDPGGTHYSPEQVSGLAGCIAVYAGQGYSFARSMASLYSWGNNSYGQLGLGHTTSPVTSPSLTSFNDCVEVSVGSGHTLARKGADNTIWGWGKNDFGQLGRGFADAVPHPTPAKIGVDSDWAQIAAGDYYSFAIKNNGAVYSWGYNGAGQLGLGYTDPVSCTVPTNINTLTCTAISAGGGHALAIKLDKTLWAWGVNSSGQLGIGNWTTPYDTPQPVGSVSDWVLINCGNSFTIAVRTNGLWSWGHNGDGQLGLGDVTHRNSPNQVK